MGYIRTNPFTPIFETVGSSILSFRGSSYTDKRKDPNSRLLGMLMILGESSSWRLMFGHGVGALEISWVEKRFSSFALSFLYLFLLEFRRGVEAFVVPFGRSSGLFFFGSAMINPMRWGKGDQLVVFFGEGKMARAFARSLRPPFYVFPWSFSRPATTPVFPLLGVYT